MKKTVLIGLTLVTFSMGAFAASTNLSSVQIRSKLTEYLDKDVKPAIFGKGISSSKGLAAQAHKLATDKILTELSSDAATRNALRGSLVMQGKVTADVVEARLNSIASLIGAKKVATELIKNGNNIEEAKSIDSSVTALTKLLASTDLVSATTKYTTLQSNEVSDAIAAVRKMETLGEAVVKMDKADRDMYTKVAEKTVEKAQNGKNLEEALVEAIMDVKSIDKTKALEIARKLKDCV